MGRSFLAALVGLATVGCGTEYVAAVRLLISPGSPLALSPGVGGYRVNPVEPTGAPIAGVSEQFIAYRDGTQEVVLELQKAASFGDGDERLLRLEVEAAETAAGPARAAGVTVVTLRREQVVDAEVLLCVDARPFSVGVLGFAQSVADTAKPRNGRAVGIHHPDLGAPAGCRLYGWLVVDGTPERLGPLSAAAEDVFPRSEDGWVSLTGREVGVSLEPIDPRGDPALPTWTAFRSDAGARLAGAAISSPFLGNGADLDALQQLLVAAIPHAGFARDSAVSGNGADARMHTEHVYVTLKGDAVLATDDFNGNGALDYLTGDQQGVGGHLAALGTATTAVIENPPAGQSFADVSTQLAQCTGNLHGAIGRLETAARALVAAPTDVSLAAALVTAADDVRGDAYDPNAPAARQTSWCVQSRVEALGRFVLSPVAP